MVPKYHTEEIHIGIVLEDHFLQEIKAIIMMNDIHVYQDFLITLQTREGFLGKNIVAVSFFKICATQPYSC